jgi:hypothetical protein
MPIGLSWGASRKAYSHRLALVMTHGPSKTIMFGAWRLSRKPLSVKMTPSMLVSR